MVVDIPIKLVQPQLLQGNFVYKNNWAN